MILWTSMKTIKDTMNRHYARRWGKKIKAISFLGGSCIKCRNKNIFQLEFHHKNGDDNKEKEINDLLAESAKWSVIEGELQKCILLCRNCHSEHHNTRNDKVKLELLTLMGKNKCSKCGYKPRNVSSLEFHHKNPDNKKFGISRAYTKDRLKFVIDKVLLEIKKCMVICRNCHNLKHINIRKFNRLKKQIYLYANDTKENSVIDRGEILKLRLEDRMAYRKIARILGCSKSVVCNVCNER